MADDASVKSSKSSILAEVNDDLKAAKDQGRTRAPGGREDERKARVKKTRTPSSWDRPELNIWGLQQTLDV